MLLTCILLFFSSQVHHASPLSHLILHHLNHQSVILLLGGQSTKGEIEKRERERERERQKEHRITIHGHKLKVREREREKRERIRKPCQALSSLPIFSTKFLHPFSPWPISHPDFFQRMAFDCSPVSREGKRRKESAVEEPSVVQMIRWIKRRASEKEREK